MTHPATLLRLAQEEARNPTSVADLRDLMADPWGTQYDALAIVLMYAYRSTPNLYPLLEASRDEWISWFRRVGYMHGMARAEHRRPTEPLTLYRAARPKHRDGLSWTTNLSTARRYHWRDPKNRFWTATADPAWLLGRYGPSMFMPNQDEYMAAVPKRAIREINPVEGGNWPLRVLFLCHGNICRSPLAALLLERRAAKRGVPLIVGSAGVRAPNGAPMDPGTLDCAADHGLDGTEHVARRFGFSDLSRWDLIVSLDPRAERVAAYLAGCKREVHATVRRESVVNPWHRSAEVHERAFQEIKPIVRDVLALAERRSGG